MDAMLEKYPEIEIVFRAGDTRPVVAQLFTTEAGSFDARITPGSVEDLDQLLSVLEVAIMVISAAFKVRAVRAGFIEFEDVSKEDSDSPPF